MLYSYYEQMFDEGGNKGMWDKIMESDYVTIEINGKGMSVEFVAYAPTLYINKKALVLTYMYEDGEGSLKIDKTNIEGMFEIEDIEGGVEIDEKNEKIFILPMTISN